MGAPPNWVFDPAGPSPEPPVLSLEPEALEPVEFVDESVGEAPVWLGLVPVVGLPADCEFCPNRELELFPKPLFPPKLEVCPRLEVCPSPPELFMPETGVAPAMVPPAMPFSESLASP